MKNLVCILFILLSLNTEFSEEYSIPKIGDCLRVIIGNQEYKLLPHKEYESVMVYGANIMDQISSSSTFDSIRSMDVIRMGSISIPIKIKFVYLSDEFTNPGTCDGIFPLKNSSSVWKFTRSNTASVSGDSMVFGRNPPLGSQKILNGMYVEGYADHSMKIEFVPHRTYITLPSHFVPSEGALVLKTDGLEDFSVEIPPEYYMMEGASDSFSLNHHSCSNDTIYMGTFISKISVFSFTSDSDYVQILSLSCLHIGSEFYGAILFLLTLISAFLYYMMYQRMEFDANYANFWVYSKLISRTETSFSSNESTTLASAIPSASVQKNESRGVGVSKRLTGPNRVGRLTALMGTSMDYLSNKTVTMTSASASASASAPIKKPQAESPENYETSMAFKKEIRVKFPRVWSSGKGFQCDLTRYEVIWITVCQITMFCMFMGHELIFPASCRFCQITWACSNEISSDNTPWENARIVMQNSVFYYGISLCVYNFIILISTTISSRVADKTRTISSPNTKKKNKNDEDNQKSIELLIPICEFIGFLCWNLSIPYENVIWQISFWMIFSISWFWVCIWSFMESLYITWNQDWRVVTFNSMISLINCFYCMTTIIIITFSSVFDIGFEDSRFSTLDSVVWLVFFAAIICPSIPIYISLRISTGIHVDISPSNRGKNQNNNNKNSILMDDLPIYSLDATATHSSMDPLSMD